MACRADEAEADGVDIRDKGTSKDSKRMAEHVGNSRSQSVVHFYKM